MRWNIRLTAIVLPAVLAGPAVAERADAQRFSYGWLGALDAGDAWTLDDPASGATRAIDLGTLPYGGGAGQQVWGDGLQYGFEGGGLVTWKSDRSAFYATSDRVRVNVDSSLFAVELFLGGVLAARPAEWLRVYAAAGPSLGWAWADHDEDDDEVASTSVGGTGASAGGVRLRLNTNDNDVSVGMYGRIGAEAVLRSGFSVGLSARYTDHRYDFGEAGELELDGTQWLLTFGQAI